LSIRLEKFRELSTKVKYVVRSTLGLSLDEDSYEGLIDVKDIQERTRVDNVGVISHTYLRLLGEMFPYEFNICTKAVEHIDKYALSIDGLSRKEAILLKSKPSQLLQTGAPLTVPEVDLTPQKQEGKGKKP
jgi:hypothetical protein